MNNCLFEHSLLDSNQHTTYYKYYNRTLTAKKFAQEKYPWLKQTMSVGKLYYLFPEKYNVIWRIVGDTIVSYYHSINVPKDPINHLLFMGKVLEEHDEEGYPYNTLFLFLKEETILCLRDTNMERIKPHETFK